MEHLGLPCFFSSGPSAEGWWIFQWLGDACVCVCVCVCMCVCVRARTHMHVQLCPTLWPHGCSPPGFTVSGIFQARVLEWVANISSSGGSSQPSQSSLTPGSPTLADGFFTTSATWEALSNSWSRSRVQFTVGSCLLTGSQEPGIFTCDNVPLPVTFTPSQFMIMIIITIAGTLTWLRTKI